MEEARGVECVRGGSSFVDCFELVGTEPAGVTVLVEEWTTHNIAENLVALTPVVNCTEVLGRPPHGALITDTFCDIEAFPQGKLNRHGICGACHCLRREG